MFFLFFSFVSCEGGTEYCSTSYDKRCVKLQDEALKTGIETRVCAKIPEDAPPMTRSEAERLYPDPDPVACKALFTEARAKCDALPYDPDSIVVTSGSSFYKGGKLVMKDGKRVCVPD